jgi:hypothetical protein
MALCLRHAFQHGAARGVILSEENSRLIDARYVVKKSRNSVGGGGQNLWALPPADLGALGPIHEHPRSSELAGSFEPH